MCPPHPAFSFFLHVSGVCVCSFPFSGLRPSSAWLWDSLSLPPEFLQALTFLFHLPSITSASLGFYPFQETYFWYFHEHLASCESKNTPTPPSPAVYLMFSIWAWSLLQCGFSLGMFSPPPATLPCSFVCFLHGRFILKFLLMSLPLVHIQF